MKTKQLKEALDDLGIELTPEILKQVYLGDYLSIIEAFRARKQKEYIKHSFPFVTDIIELYKEECARLKELVEQLKGNVSILPYEILKTMDIDELNTGLDMLSIRDKCALLHQLKALKKKQ